MKKYCQYKKNIELQFLLKAKTQEPLHKEQIPDQGTKERKAWIKNNHYSVSITLYSTNISGDLDNLAKGYLDAMQSSGIIANDCQIHSLNINKKVDKKNPRSEIEITKLCTYQI